MGACPTKFYGPPKYIREEFLSGHSLKQGTATYCVAKELVKVFKMFGK